MTTWKQEAAETFDRNSRNQNNHVCIEYLSELDRGTLTIIIRFPLISLLSVVSLLVTPSLSEFFLHGSLLVNMNE